MKTGWIKFETIEDIKNFVDLAEKTPCDVDLKSNRYVVDATSLMGVLTLNLSNPVEIVIHAEDDSLMENFKRWMV